MKVLFGCPSLKKVYIWAVFVRKKKNPSGVVSVQIIDKSSGKYRVVKTVGSSSNLEEIDLLYLKGKKWIAERVSGLDMFEQVIAQEAEEQIEKQLISYVMDVLRNSTAKLI